MYNAIVTQLNATLSQTWLAQNPWWVSDMPRPFSLRASCCNGCANRHWDMFRTMWLAIGEGYASDVAFGPLAHPGNQGVNFDYGAGRDPNF